MPPCGAGNRGRGPTDRDPARAARGLHPGHAHRAQRFRDGPCPGSLAPGGHLLDVPLPAGLPPAARLCPDLPRGTALRGLRLGRGLRPPRGGGSHGGLSRGPNPHGPLRPRRRLLSLSHRPAGGAFVGRLRGRRAPPGAESALRAARTPGPALGAHGRGAFLYPVPCRGYEPARRTPGLRSCRNGSGTHLRHAPGGGGRCSSYPWPPGWRDSGDAALFGPWRASSGISC